MGVNRLDQAGNILRAAGLAISTVKVTSWKPAGTSATPKNPRKIQPALSGHLDAVERDIKHPGVGRIDDFLARARAARTSSTGVGPMSVPPISGGSSTSSANSRM